MILNGSADKKVLELTGSYTCIVIAMYLMIQHCIMFNVNVIFVSCENPLNTEFNCSRLTINKN